MSRQTNHPLKTQSPHLLSHYTTRRVKRVTCRCRAAALQRSKLATPNRGRTGYFRSKPWYHKSHLVHSRCFSGSISHLLKCFRARPCLHTNANVRSLVNAGPRSTLKLVVWQFKHLSCIVDQHRATCHGIRRSPNKAFRAERYPVSSRVLVHTTCTDPYQMLPVKGD
jgi:hypothetical protein